jgi:hypothetical protein
VRRCVAEAEPLALIAPYDEERFGAPPLNPFGRGSRVSQRYKRISSGQLFTFQSRETNHTYSACGRIGFARCRQTDPHPPTCLRARAPPKGGPLGGAFLNGLFA